MSDDAAAKDVTASKVAFARVSAGRTKWLNTEFALFKAGNQLFRERGWHGTRVEDLAKQAGCSVKTLYNHYPTKQALLLSLYMRRAAVIHDDVYVLVNTRTYAPDIIKFIVTQFADGVAQDRAMTAAAVAALHDQKLEYPDLGEHGLPEHQGLPVILAILADVIEIGREDGSIKSGSDAFQLATYHMVGLMVTATMHPDMSGESLIELIQGQISALEADSPGSLERASQILAKEREDYLAARAAEDSSQLHGRVADEAGQTELG
jgi:AcrR family transcriptional regulator